MDASRLSRGEMIAAASAVILFIVMFFGWFGVSADVPAAAQEAADQLGVPIPDTSFTVNAWESFDFIDLILLLTVIAAVGAAVTAASAREFGLPVAASALVAGLGILSTILVLYRILDTPGGLDRKFGVFLGLIFAAGVAYGGWLSMQEEGTSFGDQADRLQDRDDNAPPPPPPPPAAPPAGGPPAGGPPAA